MLLGRSQAIHWFVPLGGWYLAGGLLAAGGRLVTGWFSVGGQLVSDWWLGDNLISKTSGWLRADNLISKTKIVRNMPWAVGHYCIHFFIYIVVYANEEPRDLVLDSI